MTNNKIALVNIYFGPFPNMFSLFLKSCSYNKHIDWIIYTDNEQEGVWPHNVIYKKTSLREIKDHFQNKLPFKIALDDPKKLCDYKPLYGYLLYEDLKQYSYWGHCDIDVIWGRLNISAEFLAGYDKAFTLGHLSLYRNDPVCNELLLKYQNGKRVKEVLSNPNLIAFDEWGEDNTNSIYLKNRSKFLNIKYGVDIWPLSWVFLHSVYNCDRNRYIPLKNTKGILYMNNGILSYLYEDGRIEEVPYIHIQKRSLEIKCEKDAEQYFITPNGYLSINNNIDLKSECKQSVLDRQYLKVKLWNLGMRLRRKVTQ